MKPQRMDMSRIRTPGQPPHLPPGHLAGVMPPFDANAEYCYQFPMPVPHPTYHPQQYIMLTPTRFTNIYQPCANPIPPNSNLPDQSIHKRERKVLEIVDPNTKSNITDALAEKPKSNRVTPNTTIENDNVRKAFREEFNQLLAPAGVKKSSAPVVPSEPRSYAKAVSMAKPIEVFEETDGAPARAIESPALKKEFFTKVEKLFSHPNIADKHASKANITEASNDKANVLAETELEAGKELEAETELGAKKELEAEKEPIAKKELEIESDPLADETTILEEESFLPDPEEERKIRDEKEAENLRLKRVELESKLAQYESERSELEINNNLYSRNFMYCVREIEKLFNITEPPVSSKELKEKFNLDIQSMPKVDLRQKKSAEFNQFPKSTSTRPAVNKFMNRVSEMTRGPRNMGGGGSGKKQLASARAAIDRSPKVELGNKAENAWKPLKISKEDQDKEENRIKTLLKSIRSLLNKITPTTKEDLIIEFLQLRVSGEPPLFNAPEGQLAQIIDIIFDKAVEEPKFCSIYSEICKRQVDTELRYNKEHSHFRNAILTRAQNTFITKEMGVNNAKVENEIDKDKKRELEIKAEEEYNKFRRRKFGNINFVGQLYYQKLLSTKIIHWCLLDLLRHTDTEKKENTVNTAFDEESLLCATQLLEVVGKSLESDQDGKTLFKQFLGHLKNIASQCIPKIRFKIIGLLELQGNNWKPRNVIEQGPKKITEIHQEIHQEQQKKQKELDTFDRKLSQGMRPTDFLRGKKEEKKLTIQRTTVESNAAAKRAAAGAASKLAASSITQPRSNMSMSTNTMQKKAWTQGSAGGGTSSDAGASSDGPGSRSIIKRNNGNPDDSEIRKGSTATEESDCDPDVKSKEECNEEEDADQDFETFND